MSVYLRITSALVVAFGILTAAGFAREIRAGADEFRRAKLRQERNPGNVLFESEFRLAEARRTFLVFSATGGVLLAVVGGSLLWGLGSLHAKLGRLEEQSSSS